jgi:hypothetical protein
VQLDSAASELPLAGQFPRVLKSPVAEMLVKVIGAEPELLAVTGRLADEPT